MDKMWTSDELRRKFAAVTKAATRPGSRTVSSQTNRRAEEIVLIIRDEPRSPLQQRHDIYYQQRSAGERQDMWFKVVREVQNSQPKGIGPWRPVYDPEAGLVMVRM